MDKPRYKNWIPAKFVAGLLVLAAALLAAARLTVAHVAALGIVLLFLAFAALFFALHVLRARTALDYNGGGVQEKVLDGVLTLLGKTGWDGRGRVLDIGCGSGAMSIKIARKYPRALVTGLDSWGKRWEYSQSLCEDNARIEGVSARITFRQGDAAKMHFADGVFDATVSNFVFHEVRSQPDKHALILEALRVVRPGGFFAFEDVFFDRSVYGDIKAFVAALKPHVSEIHFSDMRNPEYAPKFLNTRMLLGNMGAIWGRK